MADHCSVLLSDFLPLFLACLSAWLQLASEALSDFDEEEAVDPPDFEPLSELLAPPAAIKPLQYYQNVKISCKQHSKT